MKTFNGNDARAALKKEPFELSERERADLQEYIQLNYRTDQGILARNRARIESYEEYSKQTLERINQSKRIAYQYGLDLQ